MKIDCCKDCTKRTPTCHGECEDFKEFTKWNEERKKRVKKAEAKYRDQFYY